MTKLRLDLQHAFRVLIAGRLTTFAAIASLAVGIGATTAMFTVIDAVLLRTLPFPSAHRLVRVWETSPETASRNAAPANFLDWRRDSASFEGLAATFHSKMTLLAAGQPEQVRVGSVSAELFDILGVRAVHGRVFRPSEDSRDSGRLVVVGQGFWQRRFGSDPAVVGRQIMLGGQSATVIGVIGNLKLDEPADFWLLGRNGIPEGAPVPGDQSLIRDAHYIALGARHGEVIRHVLAQSCLLTLGAMTVGLTLGFVAGRAMRELLFEVGPWNPATFAVTAAGLAAVALLASYVPVRRALASDPISSLRVE
jgi:hypothetical protein